VLYILGVLARLHTFYMRPSRRPTYSATPCPHKKALNTLTLNIIVLTRNFPPRAGGYCGRIGGGFCKRRNGQKRRRLVRRRLPRPRGSPSGQASGQSEVPQGTERQERERKTSPIFYMGRGHWSGYAETVVERGVTTVTSSTPQRHTRTQAKRLFAKTLIRRETAQKQATFQRVFKCVSAVQLK